MSKKTIELTEDIKQDEPLGFLVFPYKNMDFDYMIFGEESEAHDYAMQQEEESNKPEGSWPIYALWATKHVRH